MNKEILDKLFEYRDGVLYWKTSRGRVKAGDCAGSIDAKGYLCTCISGKIYKNHRLIFLMNHGFLPKKVDHWDNNRLNNRIENLREATDSQNTFNRKTHSNNRSGFKGVFWSKQHKKWRVQVMFNGKQKSFGLYEDLELAELVAIEARNKYHGAFANHGQTL